MRRGSAREARRVPTVSARRVLTSLDDVVAPAAETDGRQPGVEVVSVTVRPEYPQPNEAFTVTWTRAVSGQVPDHTDAVQIMRIGGPVIDERPIAQGAAADTSDERTEQFDGLPLGEYTVNVWTYIEGSEGTGVPTAQGMRGHRASTLYVGNTENLQQAQQEPAATAALRHVAEAASAARQIAALDPEASIEFLDEDFRTALANAAQALLPIGSLAGKFPDELKRVSHTLPTARIDWQPERRSGTVSAIAQRLEGMAQMNAVEKPGDLAFAIIQVVGDLY